MHPPEFHAGTIVLRVDLRPPPELMSNKQLDTKVPIRRMGNFASALVRAWCGARGIG
jgi:hypothetical protein